VAVFVAIVVGLALLVLLRSRPDEAIRLLIDRQIKLSIAGLTDPRRLDELYDDTLSPRVKRACPREDFKGALSGVSPDFWKLVEYRDIHIRVLGDRAMVTYVITYNKVPIERATPQDPDWYVRATKTVYAPPIDVREELQKLDILHKRGLLTDKEYQDQRAEVIRRGAVRRPISIAGRWYDDLDRHVHCGGS
jgi:hypothetical protein